MNNWKDLQTIDQLKEAQALSFTLPVAIFKHSTRCGISLHANSELENMSPELESKIQVYYLDLLNYRSLSNLIAEELKVMHQSPQLIILKDGEAVKSSSHSGVRPKFLEEFLAQ